MSSRTDYDEALAGAHALSLLRGCTVGALALFAAPGIAYVLSLGEDWSDFAWLGPIIVIRSLEHLEPRVAERDYRYDAQFKVSLASNLLALVCLVLAALHSHSHDAIFGIAHCTNDRHSCSQPLILEKSLSPGISLSSI